MASATHRVKIIFSVILQCFHPKFLIVALSVLTFTVMIQAQLWMKLLMSWYKSLQWHWMAPIYSTLGVTLKFNKNKQPVLI